MKSLEELGELYKDFQNKVDFLAVYIEEIHAADGWSFEQNRYRMMTHKILEDRFAAAEVFQDTAAFCFPLAVDVMSNDANFNYGAIPEKLTVILDARIEYIGGIGPYLFNISEVETCLKEILIKNE